METRGRCIIVGDYGNPKGTGAGQLVCEDIPYGATEVGDAQTAMATYHAALVTAQLTATVFGDCSVAVKSENFPAKPAADVNVDRILQVTWRTKSDSSVHRQTIGGLPATSTGIDKLPEGERLNETGKAAIASALASLYKVVAPDEVIVLSGVVFQKR